MLYDSVTKELLISASESNSLGLWAALSIKAIEQPDYYLISSDIPNSYFNKVVLRYGKTLTQKTIDEVADFFQKKSLPYSWMIPHESITASVQKKLAACNLHFREEMTAMAIDLSCCFLPNANEDVSIDQVNSLAKLRHVGQVFEDSYDLEKAHALPYFKLHLKQFLRPNPPVTYYIGYLGGQAVGCGSLLVNGNIAGIYNIGTIKAARRRGVATQILVTLLREAQKRGHTQAVLTAMPSAVRLYQLIGFEEIVRYHLYFSHTQ